MIRLGRCLWEGVGYKSYKLLGESLFTFFLRHLKNKSKNYG